MLPAKFTFTPALTNVAFLFFFWCRITKFNQKHAAVFNGALTRPSPLIIINPNKLAGHGPKPYPFAIHPYNLFLNVPPMYFLPTRPIIQIYNQKFVYRSCLAHSSYIPSQPNCARVHAHTHTCARARAHTHETDNNPINSPNI
jgi:hypothetical protein